jgi:hypothetical protein
MRQLHNWCSFFRHVDLLDKLLWEKDEVTADVTDEIVVDNEA